MAAAGEATRVEPSEALYTKLRPGPGRSATEVSVHQRARIHSAMVELADERGYAGVTVRELARRAGVSTRAFYQHFDGKEDCFLSTYVRVVRRVGKRIVASQAGEGDWQERLRLAFGAFAYELEHEPQAARLVLVEGYAVGPRALEQMRCTEAMFEAMLRESFARAPGYVAMPPLVISGIVAGVACVARSRLLARSNAKWSGFGDELMEWALSYHRKAVAALGTLDRRSVFSNATAELSLAEAEVKERDQTVRDDRALVLAAVAKLVAAEGYDGLTVPRIRTAAGVSRRNFDVYFEGVKDCFLATLELRASQAIECAARAQINGETLPGGTYQAIAALCSRISSDPLLVRLCFIDIFALGSEGVRCRRRVMAGIGDLVREGIPASRRPSELVVEASVGAMWGVLQQHVISGLERQLPRIAASLAFLALAPALGAEAAEDVIRQEVRA